MRISTNQLFSQGLNAILTQQADLAKTQLQVASGKAILTPSDDPAGAKKILDLEESLAATRQFQKNAQGATSRLFMEDSVLDSVNNLLLRVRELALQGNNGTLTAADRSSISAEVEQRLQELVGIANSTDSKGEFLFGGFATRTKPVIESAGGFIYNGDQGRRSVVVAPGLKVADGNPGSEVFFGILDGNGTFAVRDNPGNGGTGVIDPGSVTNLSAWVPDTYTITFITATTFEVRDSSAALVTSGVYGEGSAIDFNGVQTSITGAPLAGDSFTLSTSVNQDMFETVRSVVSALASPDSTSRQNSMNRALSDLDQAMENVLQVRAGVGARLNTLEAETNIHADLELLIQQDLSAVQEVDLAEVISLMNRQLGALQAAHQSFAQMQNLSLFNFL